jgi:hypothetical protein
LASVRENARVLTEKLDVISYPLAKTALSRRQSRTCLQVVLGQFSRRPEEVSATRNL